MFYSPKHGRIVYKKEIGTIFNTSLPRELEKQEFITKEIADILGLIHVEPGDPPPDYNEEMQLLVYDMLDIEYDEVAGTAKTKCYAQDIFSDLLDEEGNVVKTAQQVKEDYEAALILAEAQEEERLRQHKEDSKVGRRRELLNYSAKYVLDDYEGDDKDDWIAFRAEVVSLVDRDDWADENYDYWPKNPEELALDAAAKAAYEAEMLESSE